MFASPAFAQSAGAAGGGGPQDLLVQFLPLVALLVLFYFLLIRPQQRRLKQHQAMIGSVKRGDSVVLSNGMIGKVVRVEDAEVQVEIAPNTNVRVVKSMIGEVRARGEPVAANDAPAKIGKG
jgi:preprotein translocase subunit YajC